MTRFPGFYEAQVNARAEHPAGAVADAPSGSFQGPTGRELQSKPSKVDVQPVADTA